MAENEKERDIIAKDTILIEPLNSFTKLTQEKN
jgi:hypothetical protein